MPLYLRLRDGTIWVEEDWREEDWTEEGIANRLLKAGVPHEDIVLGFHAPGMRKLTELRWREAGRGHDRRNPEVNGTEDENEMRPLFLVPIVPVPLSSSRQ
jgi:hypothetical protein